MSRLYWRAVGIICFFWVLATIAFCQTDNSSDSAGKAVAGGTASTPRSYAQFSLDLALRQDQNRFLDTYVDPNEYLVGSGDRFKVMFTSQNTPDISCDISADGNLFIKAVGSLEMGHITLAQAVAKIKEHVAKLFAGSDFTVQLSGFRFTRLNIIGAVKHPGVYYVPAIWRVSEAIELAGGLTGDASERHIKLQGFAGEESVDLVRFDNLGDLAANPLVCKGYTIIIPKRQAAEQTVGIAGLVASPGTFEYRERDRLRDYIAYAGGLAGSLDAMKLIISSPGGNIESRPDSGNDKTLDYLPHPGDNITLVWKESTGFLGTVVVTGAVIRPGRYQISREPYTLADLLAQCGGIAPVGCREMIRVFRQESDIAIRQNALAVAGADPQEKSSAGSILNGYVQVSFDPRTRTDMALLQLAAGDSVFVPRQTGMVTVVGAVAAPGLVRFAKGSGIDYYLREAGGLGFDADLERMIIINPATGGKIAATGAKELFDGEILFIPQKEAKAQP